MQQALTREIKTLKGPGQIKVNLSLKLQEVSLTPEVRQEAMINPEVVVATNMDQGAKKEAVHKAETDLILKTGREALHVSDVEKQIMNLRTAISRKKLV